MTRWIASSQNFPTRSDLQHVQLLKSVSSATSLASTVTMCDAVESRLEEVNVLHNSGISIMRHDALYNRTSHRPSNEQKKATRCCCLCLRVETCATTFEWTRFFVRVECRKRFFNEVLTLFFIISFQIANNPCANLLTAHFRLDGHPNVNYLEKVIQNASQSYLFFEPSQVVKAVQSKVNDCELNFLSLSQGDLHSHVRVRKRLRENEARRLFRQMCEVVKTCHEQGIVLRDLKLRKFVFADSERWVETFFFYRCRPFMGLELIESLRQLCLSNTKKCAQHSIHSFILLVDDFDINCSQIAFDWYETAFAYEKTFFSFDIEIKLKADMLKFYLWNQHNNKRTNGTSESKWEGNITSFVALPLPLRRVEQNIMFQHRSDSNGFH